jgi:hypothetical protein
VPSIPRSQLLIVHRTVKAVWDYLEGNAGLVGQLHQESKNATTDFLSLASRIEDLQEINFNYLLGVGERST